MNLIIIAGMPASGKTTFADRLSRELGFPILEKDAIKEELFDIIGFRNYTEKRLMDTAATAVLLRCTEAMLQGDQSVIVVNNFRSDAKPRLEELLAKYDCGCIFVFFGGDSDVFYERYLERDLRGVRHLGHVLQERFPPAPGDPLVYSMTREEFAEKFERLGMSEFRVSAGTRIDVDATWPESIDAAALVEEIRSLL